MARAGRCNDKALTKKLLMKAISKPVTTVANAVYLNQNSAVSHMQPAHSKSAPCVVQLGLAAIQQHQNNQQYQATDLRLPK